MERKLRIYADTSVFGGYFDPEFAEATQPLWESLFRGEHALVLSTLTLRELTRAPEEVRSLSDKVAIEHLEMIDLSEEAHELALAYIRHGSLAARMENDAIHIALATIARVDVLVIWNFKHVVNLNKIRIYNGVNLEMGYATLEILTPKEVIFNE
jgi:predicted nucleic acid-binding protein